jgi:hypothetical protein
VSAEAEAVAEAGAAAVAAAVVVVVAGNQFRPKGTSSLKKARSNPGFFLNLCR